MNTCCVDLKLDIFPLRNSLDELPKVTHQKINIFQHLSKDLLIFLDSLGVYPFHVEIFSALGYPTQIHVDMASSDYPKLNWVFFGSDSYVEWYKINDDAVGEHFSTPVNTPSLHYTPADIKSVIHRHYPSKNPCLFQAGIPHKSYPGSEKRYCLSIVLRHKKTNRNLTWAEMTNLFSNYI